MSPQFLRFQVQRALSSPWLRPWRVVQAAMGLRKAPDFIVVGAQKAGTTTLYDLLVRHPQIYGALRKEVDFLSASERWPQAVYYSEFPRTVDRRLGGEATPYYLFHPMPPRRVAAIAPRARIIVLLREPVARAVSHYEHERRLGFERRSISEALNEEERCMAAGLWDRPHLSRRLEWERRHHSYIGRGLYARQLARWYEAVGSDRMLVLQSEEFFTNPVQTLRRIFAFLEVAVIDMHPSRALNVGRYVEPDPGVVERLRNRFAEEMGRLRSLVDFSLWGY